MLNNSGISGVNITLPRIKVVVMYYEYYEQHFEMCILVCFSSCGTGKVLESCVCVNVSGSLLD